MANEEQIDQIISPKVAKQFEVLDKSVDKSIAKLIDLAEAAEQANSVLGKSKGMKEYSESANKAAIMQEKLAAEALKTQAIILKNDAIRKTAADKAAAAAAKEQAALDKKAAAQAKANKEQTSALGSVDQMRAKLARLTSAYNALSEAERNSASNGKVLLKDIQNLDGKIKGVAESTGNFRDSVGNYAKGAAGPLAPLVGGVEALGGAMVALPLALVAAGLYTMYKAFTLNDDASRRLEGTFAGLKTIISNTANEFTVFAQSIQESETAGTALNIISEGLIRIIPGVSLLRDGYNKLVESQKDVIDAAIQYAVGMDEITFSTNKSSVAISENELAIQRLATVSRDVTKSGQERLAALDKQSELEERSALTSIALTDQKLFLENKLLATQNKSGVEYEETQFRIFALQVERNNRLKEQEELETSQQKRRASLAKEIAAEEKKILDDQFNLQKQRLEFQRDAQKRVVEDTTASLESRLEAEKNFSSKQLDILKLTLKHDLEEVDISETKKKQLREKLANDEKVLALTTAKELNRIAADAGREAEAAYGLTLSKKEKARLDSLKNDLLAIETARDNEIAAVIGNTQEAADQRAAIEKKYTSIYIEEQLKQTEAALAQAKLRVSGDQESLNKIAELEAKVAELRRKHTEAGVVETKDAEKKKQEIIQATAQITAEAFNLLSALSNRLYQNQLNEINGIQKTNDKRYDRERENIENSTDSETQKKVKLAILDQKKAAQDAQIEERRKKAEVEAAKRDRAIKIAQIIAATAIAVLTQLSIPGAGFGLAAAAAAVGALQLATVLATPLPAYEKGGVHPHDGPALFSEKGEELRIDPDGKVSLTPPTPTVGFVKKGTEFISHDNLQKMIAMNTLGAYVSKASGKDFDPSEINLNANRNTDRLIRSMSKKNPTSTERNGIRTYKTQA